MLLFDVGEVEGVLISTISSLVKMVVGLFVVFVHPDMRNINNGKPNVFRNVVFILFMFLMFENKQMKIQKVFVVFSDKIGEWVKIYFKAI